MDLIEGQVVPLRTSDGLLLEALLHLPEGDPPFPGVVICHPHPQYGGDMYNNVVGTILRAATGAGVAALRFNFRGVGASEGSFDNGEGEQRDIEAALGTLADRAEIDESRIALAGYSFGAMIAWRVASHRPDLRTLVLVSTPTQRGASVERTLPMPALILTGDRDEYCDADLLLQHRDQIGTDVDVRVFKGVDHFWWGSDDRLGTAVAEFLRDRLVAQMEA